MKNKALFFLVLASVLIASAFGFLKALNSHEEARLPAYRSTQNYFLADKIEQAYAYDVKKDKKHRNKDAYAANYTYSIDADIPVISGTVSAESEQKINAATKALIIERIKAFISSFESREEVDLKTEKDMKDIDRKKLKTRPFSAYLFKAGFTPMMLSGRFLSLKLDFYRFEGGAHGMSQCVVYNYDFIRGRRIKLFDLFEKRSGYLKVLSKCVRKSLSGKTEALWDITEPTAPKLKNFSNFALTPDALVIFYDPYVVDCGAAGIVSVEVPWTELKDVLRPDVM